MFEIYTDGACSGNGNPKAKASWAFVVVEDGQEIKRESGLCHSDKQTSNVGELEAIYEALTFAIEKKQESAVIYSDSKYAINSLTIWSPDRKKKNIKNLDLIRSIWKLKKELDVDFVWIRGHNNNWYNDQADYLANNQLKLC